VKAEIKLEGQNGQKQQIDNDPGPDEFEYVQAMQQMDIAGNKPHRKKRIDELINMD
jgi:hypothetical protein